MAIPRLAFFNFLFNGGRGIRADQVDWSVSDTELNALLSNLGAAGNTAFALDAAPDDADGSDGDIAIARISATELRGYKKESGSWTQVWTFSGGGGDTVYLGAWSALTAQQRAAIELGQVTLRYNRFWIAHDRDQARQHGPLDAEPHGWRAIDGQYRATITAAARNYDTGDHGILAGTLRFCTQGGSYTSAQVEASNNWIDTGVDAAARQAAAAAMVAAVNAGETASNAQTRADANLALIEALQGAPQTPGVARSEVFVPFRPGSDPNKIVVETTGYVANNAYTKYNAPFYIAANGGFTAHVVDAHDFSDEDHIVALLAGGSPPDPIIAGAPDDVDTGSLSKFWRQGNIVSYITTNPGTQVLVHFVQNVGGSRYYNPDDRVANWPHGGNTSPALNVGHNWISGIRIIAQGTTDKIIEVITDGDKPAGNFHIAFGVPGEVLVENLIVPLVSDPNAYRSGTLTTIPDGRDLNMAIRIGGAQQTLHDGRHLVGIIDEERLKPTVRALQERIAELEENAQADWDETDDTSNAFIENKPAIPAQIANVQADWDEADVDSDAFIQNKPTIPSGPATASVVELIGTMTNPGSWSSTNGVVFPIVLIDGVVINDSDMLVLVMTDVTSGRTIPAVISVFIGFGFTYNTIPSLASVPSPIGSDDRVDNWMPFMIPRGALAETSTASGLNSIGYLAHIGLDEPLVAIAHMSTIQPTSVELYRKT